MGEIQSPCGISQTGESADEGDTSNVSIPGHVEMELVFRLRVSADKVVAEGGLLV